MADFEVGQTVMTDYGAVRIAALRVDADDEQEVGFVIGGQMAWCPADYVRPFQVA